MTLSATLANVIDAAVGIVSPQAAFKRKAYRKIIAGKRSATYAAAKSGRLTGSWVPVDASVNDLIRASSPQVRARVRQLARDFPIFSRAVTVLLDNVVGDGIKFQSRVSNRNGKLEAKTIQKIEDAFNFWADKADVSGKSHYYELMEIAKRQELECGEFIFVKRSSADKNRFLPYALQAIEPDWLTAQSSEKVDPANELDQGIEYNKSTGQVVAYHFTDPDGWGRATRVEAPNVIHGFKVLRPGQIRGISPFAAGVLIAHDMSEYMDATIDGAKLAAKYLAFITKADPASRTNLLTNDDDGNSIDEMENAIIEYLSPGESITIASNSIPQGNFPPTIKFLISMVACTINVPYELLSFDYTKLPYSAARVSRNDFVHYLKPEIVRHVRKYCTPTVEPFFEQSVLRGKLNLPGYFTNPWRYTKVQWQGPGVDYVDPLRESKAKITEIEAGLRSAQEVIISRGRDPEEVLKELARWKEMTKAAGLEFGQPSVADANNPAAVVKQKTGGNGNSPRAIADLDIFIHELMDKFEEYQAGGSA